MLAELVNYVNETGGITPPDLGERVECTIQNLTENYEDSPSRGGMLLCYKRTDFQLKMPKGSDQFSYCGFFEDMAMRAIKLWRLSEGRFNLRVGKDTPFCDSAGFDGDYPICGSVLGVLAMLFAMKMSRQSGFFWLHRNTERAIGRLRPHWGRGEGSYMGGVPSMGCVYCSGTLFITANKDTYEQLIDVATP